MSPATFLRALTVVLAVGVAFVVWRRRAQPGAAPFALMMLAAGEWALFALLEHAALAPSSKVFYAALEYPGIVALAPLWLLFALAYAGRGLARRRWLWAALAVMPLLTVVLVWTNDRHHLVWPTITPSSPVDGAPLVYGHGAWFWLAATYSYALLVAGTAVLVVTLARTPARYRGQTAAIFAGLALPWLGNALYLSGAPVLGGVDPTPLAFALTGVVFTLGLFKRRLFDLVPIARHALIESMADGVLVLDAQNRVLDVNPSARAMLGLTPASIGEPAAPLLLSWPALASIVAAGNDAEADARVTTARGPREIQARLSRLLDDEDHLRGRLLVLGDVTERKYAEASLRQTEKLASLAQLLAGVAHELNNPLSVVIGHAALLKRDIGGGPGLSRIEKIATAADRCARIVASFLAVARRREPECAETDVNGVLRAAVDLLAAELEQDGVRVTLDLAPDLPAIHADALQLHQVAVNLVTNAQHAMRAQVRPRRLTITSRHDAGRRRVAFSVADSGSGIPPSLRARVFEPFFTTKAVGMGSGLGLPVCRGIVEAHGGTVEITDGDDGGTVVVVELPVTAVALDAPPPAPPDPADPGAARAG